MEALRTIDAMKAKIESLKEHPDACVTEADNNVVVMREAKIEAPKPLVFKGVRDAQEVENFLWHLENYFRHVKVRDDEVKINTVVLYLTKIAVLWWHRKCADMEKGLCKIEMWEKFEKELKKRFYPMNMVYEARRKLRELRQTATIREYVREFTTLMLQIPTLSEEDSLFYFVNGLQNWAKKELRHQVANVDEAIAITESLIDFKMETAKSKSDNSEWGGGDHDNDNGKGIAEEHEGNKRGLSHKVQGSKGDDKGNGGDNVPTGGCYFCKRPYHARDYPELGKLAAMIRNFAQAHNGDIGGATCIREMCLESKPKVGDSKAYLSAIQMEHGGSKKSWADIVEVDGEL
ncbi:uncharacterized protein [Nicotiana tomentosiformis]|uniref:uncharacterized protein n=1 Tax=Nicotiana tomentosiformis TaxID=4098 RepID=UPI00388C436C